MPTIQMSVPVLDSLVSLGVGGDRSPYCRVEEKVSQTSLSVSFRFEMKGDHLGKELVSAVGLRLAPD
jgi:hypothetical protein